MTFPTREQVESQRKLYPIGCRVELVQMDDAHAPPAGTQGTVMWVDDIANCHISWDNGSSLAAAFQVDAIRRI